MGLCCKFIKVTDHTVNVVLATGFPSSGPMYTVIDWAPRCQLLTVKLIFPLPVPKSNLVSILSRKIPVFGFPTGMNSSVVAVTRSDRIPSRNLEVVSFALYQILWWG